MDLTGRKLGKYDLLERLGRGGMAQVYKAFQPGVEREVAIKVLHGHLADSVDFVERFRREALSIGQLQHPNIVRLIDFDTSLRRLRLNALKRKSTNDCSSKSI